MDKSLNSNEKLEAIEKNHLRIEVLTSSDELEAFCDVQHIDNLPVRRDNIETSNSTDVAIITSSKSVIVDWLRGLNLYKRYTTFQLTYAKEIWKSVIDKIDNPVPGVVIGGNHYQGSKHSTDEAKQGDNKDKNGSIAVVCTPKNIINLNGSLVSNPVQLPVMNRSAIKSYVWGTLSELSLAPKPTSNSFNPRFVGVKDAINWFAKCDAYKKAKLIKVSCDKAMEDFRIRAIQDEKQLVYPMAHLVEPVFLTTKAHADRNWSKKVVLSRHIYKSHVPFDPRTASAIDVFAVSAIAVDITGRWIGKFQCLCNIEFIALRELGLITNKTLVITFVSEHQIFQRLPENEFSNFNFAVDAFVTPTGTVKITKPRPRPSFNPSLLITREQKVLLENILKYFNYKKKGPNKGDSQR